MVRASLLLLRCPQQLEELRRKLEASRVCGFLLLWRGPAMTSVMLVGNAGTNERQAADSVSEIGPERMRQAAAVALSAAAVKAKLMADEELRSMHTLLSRIIHNQVGAAQAFRQQPRVHICMSQSVCA